MYHLQILHIRCFFKKGGSALRAFYSSSLLSFSVFSLLVAECILLLVKKVFVLFFLLLLVAWGKDAKLLFHQLMDLYFPGWLTGEKYSPFSFGFMELSLQILEASLSKKAQGHLFVIHFSNMFRSSCAVFLYPI